MNDDEIESYIHKVHQNELDGRKEIDLDSAMAKFIQFTHSHRDSTHTSSLFLDFDENGDGSVSMKEFEDVLVDKIHLSRRDVGIIKLKFFENPDVEVIQFDNFIKAIQLYTDAKKKGKFLGKYKPPSMKGGAMKDLLFG